MNQEAVKKYNCEFIDVVSKYEYYKLTMQLDKRNKMQLITEKKLNLNTIRDNEFDVGYSGVVNAHRW